MSALNIFIIGILLSVIGFLATWIINRITKMSEANTRSINATNKLLNESINKLQITLTGLNGIILSLKTESEISAKGCTERHTLINKTLKDHEDRIREVEKKVK